jgi:hypothetical protein
MKNKKVIRISEKKAGTFTVVPNSILHNKNLKDFDKILLFSILSDSDTNFTFNQTTYMKRFDCERKKISESIQRLTIAGYVHHEKIGFNTWVYTISEYGNLNNEKLIQNELQAESITNDLNENKETNINVIETIDLEKISIQIDNIIDNHFPNIPLDIFKEYIKNLLDAVESGKVKNDDFTDAKIIKSISKVYTETTPTKISSSECETIILNKMTGGTQNQRNDTLKKVKQWFTDNNCIATEEEIKHKTFVTHHNSKTAGVIIDPKYQD